MNIKFPLFKEQKYYNTHFKYILNIFKFGNCKLSYYEPLDDNMIIEIENKKFEFNYCDNGINYSKYNLPLFKFHCKEVNKETISFSPISFMNWDYFYNIQDKIHYKAIGTISNRQRPYATAKSRRLEVRSQLIKLFPLALRTTLLSQEDYWTDINNTKVAIFIPGQNNNMLDRGQFQYMALGCCTISPNLPEILPFNTKLIPDKHYLRCKDDYSDIEDIINNTTKETMIEIGNNARKLFVETSTPKALLNWIKQQL